MVVLSDMILQFSNVSDCTLDGTSCYIVGDYWCILIVDIRWESYASLRKP